MAKLTPLAKGLIAVTILSVTAAAAWQLGIKDLVSGDSPTAPEGREGTLGVFGGDKTDASAPLGSKSNPLKVSIVSFHGYAPALVANGNSLTTQPGSIFAQNGVNVEFIIQDDIPTLTTIFEAETAHCAWRTSDFWAQEHPNLRNAGHDARAIMIVDNTQGADAVIADTWVSMGDKDAANRHNMLAPYQVNDALMAHADKDAIFMHCLPAHREEEVTSSVMDGPQSVVFDEAENRLHAQKAVLAWCLGALN